MALGRTVVFKSRFMIPKLKVACYGRGIIMSSLWKYVATNCRLIIKANRFYREQKNKEEEITDLHHPVFAGQIFAEMLGGMCHEELYRYADQEVPAAVQPLLI